MKDLSMNLKLQISLLLSRCGAIDGLVQPQRRPNVFVTCVRRGERSTDCSRQVRANFVSLKSHKGSPMGHVLWNMPMRLYSRSRKWWPHLKRGQTLTMGPALEGLLQMCPDAPYICINLVEHSNQRGHWKWTSMVHGGPFKASSVRRSSSPAFVALLFNEKRHL